MMMPLTADELRTMERAMSKLAVQGACDSDAMQRVIDR
jgi:hypothetical protein